MKLSGIPKAQALSQIYQLKREFAQNFLSSVQLKAGSEQSALELDPGDNTNRTQGTKKNGPVKMLIPQSVGDSPTPFDGRWEGELELTSGEGSCFDKRKLSVLIVNGVVMDSSSVVGRKIVGFAVSESGRFKGITVGSGQTTEFYGTISGDRAVGEYGQKAPFCKGDFTLVRD